MGEDSFRECPRDIVERGEMGNAPSLPSSGRLREEFDETETDDELDDEGADVETERGRLMLAGGVSYLWFIVYLPKYVWFLKGKIIKSFKILFCFFPFLFL